MNRSIWILPGISGFSIQMVSAHWLIEILGTFHSTKTFENLKTVANGTEISQKRFQKFRKLLNFQMQTIQPKILEIPGAQLNAERKLLGKNFQKFGYTFLPFGCPLFKKFLKLLFHSLLEVVENSNQTVWLNGKCPSFATREICT